jgi:hypothetical protein
MEDKRPQANGKGGQRHGRHPRARG